VITRGHEAFRILSMLEREREPIFAELDCFVVGIDCADSSGVEFEDEPRGRVGGMPSWPFSAGKCGAIGGGF